MNIAVIGGSAGIGLQVVMQAIEKNYTVKILSRNSNLITANPLITRIAGSADSVEDLKKALIGTDAAVITVGTKKKKNTTLFSNIARALIKAISELNYGGPVVIITGFGTGESKNYLSFFMRCVINLFLKDQYNDKTLMEEIITTSDIKWEIVKPGILTNGPLTSKYKVLPTLKKGMKIGKISRADAAHFLLHEAENPTMLYQYVAITGY